MNEHKQLPFRLADNTHTEVDEGLYEFLLLLRDLGVVTSFSCQGNRQFSAYVVGSAETFGPVIEKLQAMAPRHYVLAKIFSKPAEETWFHQGKAVVVVNMEEPYEWYTWELDHHDDMGDRYVLRWKPKATPLFVEALKELHGQFGHVETEPLKEKYHV